ncbi:MAG: ATP-dependent DNA helicase, partial [Acidimicrobiales bacterium]
RVEFRHSTGRDPSIREERSWVAKTRAGKQRWHRGRLSDQWGGMAAAHGLTRERVDGLLRRRVGGSLPGRADGRRRLVAELLGAEGLTATDATFDAGRARRLGWERAPGLVTAEDVELAVRELVEREEVVAVAPGVWTTKEMQELEEQVLAWRRRRAERRDDSDADELDPTAWLEALARCPLTLTEEQQAALEAVVSEETWVALTGEAGVGKGVVLRVASDTWDGEGRRVFALAVAGKRAQALATDLGEHAEAMTLDAFTRRVRDGKITVGPNDVVALDEASLVDTRRWAGLADVLGDRGLVRAIGDDAQLSSIAPGGLWRHLSDQGPRLSEVRRTRHAWERQAWTHLRAGEARDALELYARRGRVHISDTRAAALEQAVAAWDRDGRSGLIITDASNAERHKLNALAQGLRQAAGELGTSTVRFRGVAGEVNLHEGDRVSFRAQYSPETGRRVENGVGAEVIGVDALRGLVGVRTHEERPRLLQVSVEDFRDLDLAYAAHVHKAQGDTVERGYIVSGGWQTNRESLYVAASRSRDGAEIFLDRQTLGRDADPDVLVAMAARADRSGRKVASVEGELPTARQERGYEGRSLRDAATEAPRSEWAPNVGDGLAAAVRAAERADALDALGSARPAFDAGLGWRDLSAREAVRMVQSRDLRPVENGGGTGPYNGARSGVSRQEHQRQAARPPQPTRTPPQPTPSLPGDR